MASQPHSPTTIPASLLIAIAIIIISGLAAGAAGATTTWCVARSEASVQALQTALDYACGTGGADCAPLQASNGLCFLPNTIQAHASYAFNSYYHRRSMAPGSCDFSGTATVAQSDPSYGSCVYPSSLSTAGGNTPTTTSTGSPTTTLTPTTSAPGFGSGGVVGINPGTTPTIPDNVDNSRAPPPHRVVPAFFATLGGFSCVLSLLVFS